MTAPGGRYSGAHLIGFSLSLSLSLSSSVLLSSPSSLSSRLKPRINTETIDLESLRSLPRGMFGREYVRFLDLRVRYENCFF